MYANSRYFAELRLGMTVNISTADTASGIENQKIYGLNFPYLVGFRESINAPHIGSLIASQSLATKISTAIFAGSIFNTSV